MSTAAWIVALWLAGSAVVEPVGREALLRIIAKSGGTAGGQSWPDFWRNWGFRRFNHALLALLLAWGGFWS